MTRLGGGAIVETQQSAESFHASNRTEIGAVAAGRFDQSVAETLMVPLHVIMGNETELLLEDSVLLSEVLDDRILLAANPAGQSGETG